MAAVTKICFPVVQVLSVKKSGKNKGKIELKIKIQVVVINP